MSQDSHHKLYFAWTFLDSHVNLHNFHPVDDQNPPQILFFFIHWTSDGLLKIKHALINLFFRNFLTTNKERLKSLIGLLKVLQIFQKESVQLSTMNPLEMRLTLSLNSRKNQPLALVVHEFDPISQLLCLYLCRKISNQTGSIEIFIFLEFDEKWLIYYLLMHQVEQVSYQLTMLLITQFLEIGVAQNIHYFITLTTKLRVG